MTLTEIVVTYSYARAGGSEAFSTRVPRTCFRTMAVIRHVRTERDATRDHERVDKDRDGITEREEIFIKMYQLLQTFIGRKAEDVPGCRSVLKANSPQMAAPRCVHREIRRIRMDRSLLCKLLRDFRRLPQDPRAKELHNRVRVHLASPIMSKCIVDGLAWNSEIGRVAGIIDDTGTL